MDDEPCGYSPGRSGLSVNRRGFISLLAGTAGAVLVPWRGQVEPIISLPPRHICSAWCNMHPAALTQQSLEEMLASIQRSQLRSLAIMPRQLIVSPRVKQLIDTDPVIRRAAEMALRGEYLPEELGLDDQTRRS
jgi:hypothetical protein